MFVLQIYEPTIPYNLSYRVTIRSEKRSSSALLSNAFNLRCIESSVDLSVTRVRPRVSKLLLDRASKDLLVVSSARLLSNFACMRE